MNKVYKVETVKDCFVGVAGAPERAKNHAELIMDMAMDMRDSVCFVKDPRPGTDTHIKIRLGSHSGQVVGGIVGNKCPRYCLFGDDEHELSDDELRAGASHPRVRCCQGPPPCRLQCQGEGQGDCEGKGRDGDVLGG